MKETDLIIQGLVETVVEVAGIIVMIKKGEKLIIVNPLFKCNSRFKDSFMKNAMPFLTLVYSILEYYIVVWNHSVRFT